MSNAPALTRDEIKAMVLAVMRERADAYGLIADVRVIDISRAIKRSNAETGTAIKGLMRDGVLSDAGLDGHVRRYRLAGYAEEVFVEPPPPTIEAVTRIIRTAGLCSSSGGGDVAISLPRVKCLERPL